MVGNKKPASKRNVSTYFYVFADASHPRKPRNDTRTDATAGSEISHSLDSIVTAAFNRFAHEYEGEACVESTLEQDVSNRIRQALGIQQLPAFGISNTDLTSMNYLSQEPQNVPSPLNIFKFAERKAILNKGTVIPTVERPLVAQYPSEDSLYNFVRDLHVKNMDDGLTGVTKSIRAEIKRLNLGKIVRAASIGKKLFMG